jgi:hypothetical protein
MAVLAKGLPIAFIPEEALISTVRKNMVHDSSRYKFSAALALHTKRKSAQISLSRRSPSSIVAS